MDALRILVVDDESAVRAALRLGLEAEGWEVAEAGSSAELFAALERAPFDLVTLDLVLGAEDGLDLARRLRARRNVPVLMITGKGLPADRVRGLDQGADDYIVKPFHIREVVLRIRNTMARYGGSARAARGEVAFGHGTYDASRGVIRRDDGSAVELTGIELQIFQLFVGQPGRIFSRDDISRVLHGRDWSPLDRTIDGHVARLRRKLDPAGVAMTLIRSVRGVGYVFAGEIRPVSLPV